MEKVAVLILAHNDITNLNRLIKNFPGEMYDVFIHIDKKSDMWINRSQIFIAPNIRIIEKTYKVYWGGYTVVEATMSLIKNAVSMNKYFFYILISGLDYPIKNTEELYKELSRNRGKNYIKAVNLDSLDVEKKYKKNIQYCNKMDFLFFNNTNSFLFKLTRKIINFFYSKKKIRRVDKEFEIYHGSQWWALNGDTIEKIIHESELKNKELKYLFERIFASDEKYFHSIYYNSIASHEEKLEADNYKNFNLIKPSELSNITTIDDSLSKYYTINDIEEIKTSSKFFVRKVNSKHSADLLDEIDKFID